MEETDRRTETRILLVEDDEPLADVVEARLLIEGMLPMKCASTDALAALASSEFDAVVLDVVGDGTERTRVLSRIRARAAVHEVPVVLLTSRGSPIPGLGPRPVVARCQTVMKPFTGQELMRKLRLSLVPPAT
jgi:DNA-binding response OmpR family regulator